MKRLRVFGWFLLGSGAAAVLLLVVLNIFTSLQTTAIALIGISTFIPWMWLP